MKNIQVAKVLDECRVVINIGEIDGIKEGARVILYEFGDEIKDPTTGENLGKVEIIKGSGVVTHVQEKISTVESNMKKDSGKSIRRKSPYSASILSAMSFIQPYEVVEELPKETKPFENPEIGDLVRLTRN